jgi:hypothetical protein
MEKNDIKEWLIAAGVRAVKTAAQTLIALIGTDMVSIVSLDWPQMLGVVATATVLSLLTSVAGVPEANGGKSLAKQVSDNRLIDSM